MPKGAKLRWALNLAQCHVACPYAPSRGAPPPGSTAGALQGEIKRELVVSIISEETEAAEAKEEVK